jgi:mRNA-degrading endonuclease toxin of MazEF toxin-antitoxin module
MTLQRGDIGLTRFPHAGGNRGKKRPAVIVQADVYNASVVCCLFLSTVAEAGITQVIGQLSAGLKAQLDACLKAALQLP